MNQIGSGIQIKTQNNAALKKLELVYRWVKIIARAAVLNKPFKDHKYLRQLCQEQNLKKVTVQIKNNLRKKESRYLYRLLVEFYCKVDTLFEQKQ